MKKVKIIWAEYAQSELEDIYQYYVDNIGTVSSQRLLLKILDDTTSQLSIFPESGTVEENLLSKKYEYRYLVINNYKIIYRHNDNYVLIVRVFDCRMNPEKMIDEIE